MTVKTSVWPSPAKLNLFLYITGQREDGYHYLQTLFQFIDYGDSLTISTNNSGNITLSPPIANVKTEQNLIYRAAMALKNEAQNKQLGAHIEINKVLPMGAGLGGGSSNAATCLIALNELWGLEISPSKLIQIGLSLGADVPVFIQGSTAFAQGIGEQLQAIDPKEYGLKNGWYLIVKPNVSISTAKIFSHPQLSKNTIKRPLATLLSLPFSNDCEKTVRSLYPEVDNALSWLSQYAPARLTGTGACIFALFDDANSAQQVLNQLPSQFSGFIAKGIHYSPVLEKLNAIQKNKSL